MKERRILPQTLLFLSNPINEEGLFHALISQFLNERDKLGLDLSEHQIEILCRTLLTGGENTLHDFNKWQINERSIFDDYRKDELEIVDYLHLVSIEMRKQWGQYATPQKIARYILKSVNYVSTKSIINKKIIDPSCGSGVFLVEAARIYLFSLKKANVPQSKWYPLITSAIAGIDIDPKACFFTRLNLSMILAPAILQFATKNNIKDLNPLPVYCADTLELFVSEASRDRVMYGDLNILLRNQFDFVVGNPPYFKISGLSKRLKSVFSESIYGHPNTYGLFIHAGIDMLKPQGKLGFIVPRSMLSGLYFKNLRGFIEKNTAVKEITSIAERKKTFDHVLHGTMILILEHNKNTDDEKVAISNVQSSNDLDIHNQISIHRDQIIQHLNGTTVWFIAESMDMYNIINRIIKEHPLLSGQEINCRAKTGQIVWNRVKPLLAGSQEPDTLPLIWATDVGKFGFTFNRIGTSRPCFLRVTSKTGNLIINEPGILVQRITADEQYSRIVASLPHEFCKKELNGYFVENHLNIIQSSKRETKTDLYFLLGVLNSEIVEFFFRAMNGNTQVSATELNLLPIPRGDLYPEIAGIAKKLQEKPFNTGKSILFEKLNLLVSKAYGLSGGELLFIKQYLQQRRGFDYKRN